MFNSISPFMTRHTVPTRSKFLPSVVEDSGVSRARRRERVFHRRVKAKRSVRCDSAREVGSNA